MMLAFGALFLIKSRENRVVICRYESRLKQCFSKIRRTSLTHFVVGGLAYTGLADRSIYACIRGKLCSG